MIDIIYLFWLDQNNEICLKPILYNPIIDLVIHKVVIWDLESFNKRKWLF